MRDIYCFVIAVKLACFLKLLCCHVHQNITEGFFFAHISKSPFSLVSTHLKIFDADFTLLSDPWRLGQQWGCVLVGHSFGGLMIKSLVVEAYQGAQVFPRNRIDELSVASAKVPEEFERCGQLCSSPYWFMLGIVLHCLALSI
jgi:hypothetical protein